jgi:uncharacterized protein (TIGR00725 family)
MPRGLLVGVVGATSKKADATSALAFQVGKELAQRGDVVVTGGHHASKTRDSVKVRAILGALETGAGARVLGLLPGKKVPVYKGRGMARYVPTDLGHGRNILTGSVPDALIALPGESGTLSEVAFARAIKRPVVFVGWNRRQVMSILDLEKSSDGACDYIRSAPDLNLPRVPTTNLVSWLAARIRLPKCQFAENAAEAAEMVDDARMCQAGDILGALAVATDAACQRVGRTIEMHLQELGVIANLE